MHARIEAVCLATPGALRVRDRDVDTGIFKRPRDGAHRLGPLGLEGDVRVEPRAHGESHHAVCVYPIERYRAWAAELDRPDLGPGLFGENLTTSGLLETDVRIGDVLSCGSALVQVASPRIPCRKLDARMGRKLARRFLETRRVGYYLRVVEPGTVQAGDALRVIDSDGMSPTVDEFVRIAMFEYWDSHGLRYLLGARDLVPGWRETIEAKLARSDAARGWNGLRELVITSRIDHDDIVTLELGCPSGRRLPDFRAGQSLILTARADADAELLRRRVPISSPPDAPRGYRVSIDVGSRAGKSGDDAFGAIARSQHTVGERVRCGEPQGGFTLAASETSPSLWLIGEGLGCAPLLSMLHVWESRALPARITLAREGGRDLGPLDSELHALEHRHRGGQLRVSSLDALTSGGGSAPPRGAARGVAATERDDTHTLDAIADTDIYVAGTVDFVRAARARIEAAGADPSRIREDRLAS